MSLFRRSRQSNRWEPDDAVPGERPCPDDSAGLGDDSAIRAEAVDARPRARRRGRRAAAVGTVTTATATLARLVLLAGVLIAVLIGLAILLRDVDANARNSIVKGIHDAANVFAGAFTGIATLHGHPKRAITIDWGIAVLVYLAAAIVIAAVVRRFARQGLAWQRGHRAGAVT